MEPAANDKTSASSPGQPSASSSPSQAPPSLLARITTLVTVLIIGAAWLLDKIPHWGWAIGGMVVVTLPTGVLEGLAKQALTGVIERLLPPKK